MGKQLKYSYDSAGRGRDKEGWKRGCMGIDGHQYVEMSRPKDYASRGIDPVSFGEPMKGKGEGDQGLWNDQFKPGPVSKGGPPRFKPKMAGDVSFTGPASPKGKYASKGIGKFIVR